MISGLNSSSDLFLNALAITQRKLDRAQQQLTSGKRVVAVSDDADQISTLLQARAELNGNVQSKADLGRVKAEVDTAEGAIATAVSLVEKARVLSAQGATSTSTAQSRATLGGQLGDILNQLTALANTTVEGRNIFSGDSDQTAAYAIDLNQPVPTGSYLGTTATRQIRHPSGAQFAVSKTAQDIFDSPNSAENVFQSINAVRLGFLNNDQVAIDAAVPNIDTAGQFLSQQHAFYGTVQNQVNDGIDVASKRITRGKALVSSIEDADVTSAALDLNQAVFQQNVSLQSRAKLRNTSLFDFLG